MEDDAGAFAGTAGLPVLLGLNRVSGAVVTGDRWALDNHNAVVLARSGAGKSYAVKTGILRELYNGVRVSVIDPEREYLELARQVGGRVIELGAPGVRINPMHLPAGDPDALTRRCLFLHTLVDVMLDEPLDPSQRAALDQAVIGTYARAGITQDPRTWTRRAPTIEDLLDQLAHPESTNERGVAAGLLERLSPWVTGSYSGLFGRPNAHHDPHDDSDDDQAPASDQLTVWTTRLLAEELRPVGMLLAIDAIWRSIDRRTTQNRPDRQLVVVDEASLLLSEPAGARFLARLAKTARKRRAGLTLITPDVVDVLGSDLGETILANAATVLLLRQAPQAIQTLTRACALSPGEAQFLVTAGRGQALLLAGARVPLDIVASPAEHAIAAALPDELGDIANAFAVTEELA
nr:DUF87 domain-containing protein [Kineosporia babensis]